MGFKREEERPSPLPLPLWRGVVTTVNEMPTCRDKINGELLLTEIWKRRTERRVKATPRSPSQGIAPSDKICGFQKHNIAHIIYHQKWKSVDSVNSVWYIISSLTQFLGSHTECTENTELPVLGRMFTLSLESTELLLAKATTAGAVKRNKLTPTSRDAACCVRKQD